MPKISSMNGGNKNTRSLRWDNYFCNSQALKIVSKKNSIIVSFGQSKNYFQWMKLFTLALRAIYLKLFPQWSWPQHGIFNSN